MKARHAAALALVGWYLMTPPILLKCPDEGAPLSRWTVEEAFDTARECKNKLNNYMLNALHSGSGECHFVDAPVRVI
jgi:hypothetical protein